MTAQPAPVPARLVLEYTLTADDLVDGSRAYYRHQPMFGYGWHGKSPGFRPGTRAHSLGLASIVNLARNSPKKRLVTP